MTPLQPPPMATVSSIRPPTFAFLALLLLSSSSYSAAFVGPHNLASEPRHRQQAHKFLTHEDIAGITSLHVKKNTNNNNNSGDDLESKKTYTKIDDGSPLGVAIVGIGGLLYAKGGDTFSLLQDSPNAVWIILATASTAAGLSRLFRYINEKQQNNNIKN
ncbi:hypothetical protein ACHAXM_000684 [Skeletonema potamos]|jgi:hypothetical protein